MVFETGPLSVWFYHDLTAQCVPEICIDVRHAKAALNMAANKTDANDADRLAHLAEVGFYKVVRVKDSNSMLTRTLVGARGLLIKIVTDLSNQIRGLMKTLGLIVPKGAGRVFEYHVRRLLASNGMLEQIIVPLLEAWCSIRTRAAELDRQLVTTARTSTPRRLLMSIPGVGAVPRCRSMAGSDHPALCPVKLIMTDTYRGASTNICGFSCTKRLGLS